MGARRSRPGVAPGVIATLAALTVGYWAPGLGLPRLDLPMLNGNLLVPEATSAAFGWTVGLAHTLVLGGFLGAVYRRMIRARLPGGPATRGALWGLVVGTFAGFTVFPLLYGAGIFGLQWGPGAPVTIVLWFLTWGATLGIVDGP